VIVTTWDNMDITVQLGEIPLGYSTTIQGKVTKVVDGIGGTDCLVPAGNHVSVHGQP